MTLLVERRFGERCHLVVAGVERVDEALDGTTLAGGVAALEHEQQSRAKVASHLTTEVESEV